MNKRRNIRRRQRKQRTKKRRITLHHVGHGLFYSTPHRRTHKHRRRNKLRI